MSASAHCCCLALQNVLAVQLRLLEGVPSVVHATRTMMADHSLQFFHFHQCYFHEATPDAESDSSRSGLNSSSNSDSVGSQSYMRASCSNSSSTEALSCSLSPCVEPVIPSTQLSTVRPFFHKFRNPHAVFTYNDSVFVLSRDLENLVAEKTQARTFKPDNISDVLLLCRSYNRCQI